LALALFLLNAGCPSVNLPSTMKSPPSFDGKTQIAVTEVDDFSNGSIDDDDSASLMDVSPPVQLAQASSNNTVTAELSADADTILFTCAHAFSPSFPGTTDCFGTVTGTFEIAEEAGDAAFTLALPITPVDPPAQISQSFAATFGIDCGAGQGDFSLSTSSTVRQEIATVPVGEGATECAVSIRFDLARVTSTGVFADITQTASVTARNVAPVECQHESQCGPGERCSADGLCTLGLEGSTCDVAAVHCNTPFCNGFRECSDGHAASFARGGFECSAGYTFEVFECHGDDCTMDSQCPPERPICTDRGCSETGERGDGCSQGFGCRSGLCLSHVCTLIAGFSADCSGPNIVCAFGLNCFHSTGTCQDPLGTGEACGGNDECNFPSDSCIAGLCSPRSGDGDSCDVGDDADCIGVLPCQNSGICGF
jgi:hypothetical protein